MKNRRKLANFIRSGKDSTPYHIHFLIGGLAFVTILFLNAARSMGEVNAILEAASDTALVEQLQGRIWVSMVTLFIIFATFFVGSAIYLLVIVHRVRGPIVALQAYIDELIKGNYDHARSLRKGDELEPVMTKLQELAEHLKKQSAR